MNFFSDNIILALKVPTFTTFWSPFSLQKLQDADLTMHLGIILFLRTDEPNLNHPHLLDRLEDDLDKEGINDFGIG